MISKSDDRFKWLVENFNYIDSLTMIDNKGRIIVKQRFNPRYTEEENAIDNRWALNRNLLDVFPSLDYENSSLLQTLSTGEIICCEGQTVFNHIGRTSVTNNITFPVITRGKIVGAVEISRDVTHMESGLEPPERKVYSKTKKTQQQAGFTLADIITQNTAMLELKHTIRKIANSGSSVFVYGETGTGKELVVSAIHNAGDRRDKPFIAVNCAALPESILEGLLFGSQKGAFTGAENKKGLFEEANGGTIYLDEINSMPAMLQAKLLRVLQDKAVTPLGTAKPVQLDVRIIASTNQPVRELVGAGQMREDILYRLKTISLDIPPLRERMDDIPLLSAYFIDKYNEALGKQVPGITGEALEFFYQRSWKGNVRELEHVIESAMNLVDDNREIGMEHLPDYLMEREPGGNQEPGEEQEANQTYKNACVSLADSLSAYERKLILEALKSCNGRIVDAAKKLQIPRTSLQYKIEKYGIKRR